MSILLTRRLAVAASLVVAALGLSGCGDDDSAAGSIPKEEFLEAANAICEEGAAEIEAAEAEAAFGPDFFIGTVIPSIRQQMADMRALGFPEGDEEAVGSIFDDTEAVLDTIEADAESVGSAPNPFAGLNERMDDYGLTVCAEG